MAHSAHTSLFHRFLLAVSALIACIPQADITAADKPAAAPINPARLSAQAVQLPGTGFHDAAGFDIIDWNADGLPDLYIHDTGSIAKGSIHFNTGTLSQPRFHTTAAIQPYNCTETFPQTIEHCQSRTFCDLNHDGLPDLILFDGQLRYLPNTGHPTGWNLWHLWKGNEKQFFPATPAMVAENARISAGPQSMFWDKGIFARQVITFTAADLNADGLQDLIVCRMIDQQPGVRTYNQTVDQWTPRGRMTQNIGAPLPPFTGPPTLDPLSVAPQRQTVLYKNIGTKNLPNFDKGNPLTLPNGSPLVAPNPILADVDGDGLTDLVSSEAPYTCNAFRVDWPTQPNVVWFKRLSPDGDRFAAPIPLTVNGTTPVPSGTMARLADLRASGSLDLLVMDPQGAIRWYINRAPKGKPALYGSPQIITASDFPRFEFMFQPIVVDWYGPGSRDLILHGVTDPHCKWGLRRTTLFKNTATKAGEISYQRVGDLTFNGDPTIVNPREEFTPYGIYGTYAALMPDNGLGKRLLMTVDGKTFLFSNLAPDGLTFTTCTSIPLAGRRDVFTGWQEFPVKLEKPVSYISVTSTNNSLKILNLLAFEAYADGKNVATIDEGARISNMDYDTRNPPTPRYHRIQNPNTMLTPGAQASPTQLNATIFGFHIGPAVIKLANPAKIDRFRVHFSDRDESWYKSFVPFEWQGKTYRMVNEIGQYWGQIIIATSQDGATWETNVNRMYNEMARANPVPIDWNNDGKTDLVVAALGHNEGIYPDQLTYRLYLNQGTEAAPVFGEPIIATNEKKVRLTPRVNWTAGYAPMCGLKLIDMDNDTKLDLVVENAASTSDSTLQWHKNISAQPADFTFEAIGRPFANDLARYAHHGRYRYFDYADVDGDGVRDVLNAGSYFQRLYFVRGIHPDAPQSITDLTRDSASTLSWTRPANAESYDLRLTFLKAPDEINWSQNTTFTAPYTVPVGQRQTITLPALKDNERRYAAVKSLDAQSHLSSISNALDFVPANSVVLANGLPDASGVPYQGFSAAVLAQGAQGKTTTPDPKSILILPPTPDLRTGMPNTNAWITLVKFDQLPKTPIASATLRLTISKSDGALRDQGASTVSCSQIELPADLTKADWNQSGFAPWPENYLLKSGRFISFGNPPTNLMSSDPTMTWNVAAAVNRAITQGKSDIILLLRNDYTGHYTGGAFRFCTPEAANPAARPTLELITQ